MDFRITAAEEALLFVIVGHLDAGDAPTLDELSQETSGARLTAASLRDKGWILIQEVDGGETVTELSPMALKAVSNLRYAHRE